MFLSEQPKTAYILRGLPGSGKSTLATELVGIGISKVSCSTDDFFMHRGEYKFDPTRLKEYHAKNKERFEKACAHGTQVVICDNTNTQKWEYEPYVEIAKKHGYRVQIVVVGNPKDPEHVKACIERNIHGVPAETIQKMADRFEL